MLDWDRIAGFDWDAGNLDKSATKHGVDWAEAEQIFFNSPLLFVDDETHGQHERRIRALGRSDTGRLLFAVFTLRAEASLIRIISVRDMNTKEKRVYEQEKA